MKITEILKRFSVAGLMVIASWTNCSAVIVLRSEADATVYSTLQTSQKAAFYLKRGLQVPDVDPKPQGGAIECKRFLAKHLEYPMQAVKAGIQGKVVLELMVDEKGKITDVKVLKGLHPLLDEEAVRVCSMMPKFKPAKLKGKGIPSVFVMPVTFRLQ